MERNVRLLLCYDGTDFHGWQRQPGVRTVQSDLEATLRRVLQHDVRVIASGRTDAGVHAFGQVANFRTDRKIPTEKLHHAIGSRLPEDIGIRHAQDVSDEFHATRSAEAKLYRYRIFNSTVRPVSQMAQRYTYHVWRELDLNLMRSAAVGFLGTRDFSSLAAAGCVRHTMVRTIHRCDVYRSGHEIHIDVEGAGFLYHQVRIMAGTLVDVGMGRIPPESIEGILAGMDRSLAGPTAPAAGLCLRWVRYPADLLRSDDADRTETSSDL
jgi:tRNA pseudouridine38-40 synthase